MISKAKECDLQELSILIFKYTETCPLRLPTPSLKKVIHAFQKCLDTGVIFKAERKERIVGLLALYEGEFWYSHSKFLADMAYFVEPSSRSSRFASHLLKSAKEYATMRDLPLLMGVTHGGDVARKDHFYARHGMDRIGGIYCRGM